MLDDTLVVWTGEFGRTVYCQGKMTREQYGRDHPSTVLRHVDGRRRRQVRPDDRRDRRLSYNVTKDPVHVHDLNATIMHLLGIDHIKLTYQYQGRHFRLTDVHGDVVKKALA